METGRRKEADCSRVSPCQIMAVINRPDASASPFDSEIFVLVVGTQKKRFRAHSAYLSQSPVFDAMCHHSFKESKTHQIDLPEDDPEVFSLILKYLYAGNFAGYDGLLDDDSLDIDRDVRALRLADVFLLAEKY